MKRLIVLVLLTPLFCCAQTETYATLRAVDFKYSGSPSQFGGMFSVGGKEKLGGAGVGIGIIKFKDIPNVYIPIYAEVVAFGNPKEAGFFLNGQIGYGIFKYDGAGIQERGGLFFHPNAGLLLPIAKKTAVILTVGYVNSSFSVKTIGRYAQTSDRTSSGGISFGAGFKF